MAKIETLVSQSNKMSSLQNQIEIVDNLAKIKSVVSEIELKRLSVDSVENLIKIGKLTRSTSKTLILKDAEITANRSIVEAIALIPEGIVCLGSALEYYELTPVIPGKVHLAIPNTIAFPDTEELPVKLIPMTATDYSCGTEIQILEGVEVKIFSVPKTIADCFDLYWKIGLDIALQAIEESLRNQICTKEDIEYYCRKRNLAPHILQELTTALANPEEIYSYT